MINTPGKTEIVEKFLKKRIWSSKVILAKPSAKRYPWQL